MDVSVKGSESREWLNNEFHQIQVAIASVTWPVHRRHRFCGLWGNGSGFIGISIYTCNRDVYRPAKCRNTKTQLSEEGGGYARGNKDDENKGQVIAKNDTEAQNHEK